MIYEHHVTSLSIYVYYEPLFELSSPDSETARICYQVHSQ